MSFTWFLYLCDGFIASWWLESKYLTCIFSLILLTLILVLTIINIDTPKRHWLLANMSFKLLKMILIPTIVCLGAAGNIMSFLTVTNRNADKSSYTVYLASLAVVDMMSLTTITIGAGLPIAFGINLSQSAIGNVYCRLSQFSMFLSTDISAWLTVLIALERSFCVYFPHQVKRFCRPNTGKVITMILVTFFLAFNSHLVYGYVLGNTGVGQNLARVDEQNVLGGEDQSASSETVATEMGRTVSNWTDLLIDGTDVSVTADWLKEASNNKSFMTQSTLESNATRLFNTPYTNYLGEICILVNEEYSYFFKTWVWVEMVIYFILPVLTISIANTATWLKVYRSARVVTSSVAALAIKRSRHIMILSSLISTAYVVFLTPATLLILYISYSATEEYRNDDDANAGLEFASLCLLLCNHSCNFCLYILSGSKFRNDFKSVFCKTDRQTNNS